MSTTTHHDQLRPVSTPREERAEVAAFSRALEGIATGSAPTFAVLGPRGERLPIPAVLLRVLGSAASVLARGDAISVVAVGQALTTQEAADLLNVSRQYLVRLLDGGKIPCTRTGSHRRLRLEDVLTFKDERDRERGAALGELTALSEEFDGYSELK